jgi:hypothetical protein
MPGPKVEMQLFSGTQAIPEILNPGRGTQLPKGDERDSPSRAGIAGETSQQDGRTTK